MNVETSEFTRVEAAVIARGGRRAKPPVVLDSGRSLVLETANDVIVRAGRIEGSAERYRREAALLGALGNNLPFKVATVRWVAEPDSQLPHGAIAMERLPGITPSSDLLTDEQQARLAPDLGRAIAALHTTAIDPSSVRLPDAADLWHERMAMWDGLTPELRRRSPEEFVALGQWKQSLQRPVLDRAVLVHGDLWYENVRVDPSSGRLLAILDFEDAHIGDPAMDFARQRLFGSRFAAAVEDSYVQADGVVDDGFRERERLWWQLGAISSAHYSRLVGDQRSLETALEEISRRVLAWSRGGSARIPRCARSLSARNR